MDVARLQPRHKVHGGRRVERTVVLLQNRRHARVRGRLRVLVDVHDTRHRGVFSWGRSIAREGRRVVEDARRAHAVLNGTELHLRGAADACRQWEHSNNTNKDGGRFLGSDNAIECRWKVVVELKDVAQQKVPWRPTGENLT